MANDKKTGKNNQQQLSEKRVKYFMGLIDVKRDTNMTRIYSAIKSADFTHINQT